MLRGLLDGLPSDFSPPTLIAVHTGPSSPGYMAPILDRYSALQPANHGELVEAGKVYLAPADRHLEVVNLGLVYLSGGPKVRFTRPAADRLFVTASEVFGSRVISLIFSGGDCDGANGRTRS